MSDEVVVATVGSGDLSWKLRTAAVLCIDTYIRVLSGILRDNYDSLARSLMARFKERDQNIRALVSFGLLFTMAV